MTESNLARTAFVFPGQGSQAVGMGKDLADTHESARQLFARADEVLGFPLSKICFEGPQDELKKTENTQPALYVVSCATLTVLRERGVGAPESVAGHSLGEYSALFAAGVFDFETGLKLVRARGEAMYAAGQARPGTMAAVLAFDGKTVAEICERVSEGASVVVAANYNSPDQTVISGDVDAVNRASLAIREAGGKRVIPLPVSGAFHSPLVQPAAETMRAELDKANLEKPKSVRFINNADADLLKDPETIADSLVRQIISPVRWVETIQRLWDLGTRRFVEVGSGKVLSGLIRRMHSEAEVFTTENAASLSAAAATLKSDTPSS